MFKKVVELSGLEKRLWRPHLQQIGSSHAENSLKTPVLQITEYDKRSILSNKISIKNSRILSPVVLFWGSAWLWTRNARHQSLEYVVSC